MTLWALILLLLALCGAVIAVRRLVPESAQPVKAILVWVLIVMAVYVVALAIGLIDALRRLLVPHL